MESIWSEDHKATSLAVSLWQISSWRKRSGIRRHDSVYAGTLVSLRMVLPRKYSAMGLCNDLWKISCGPTSMEFSVELSITLLSIQLSTKTWRRLVPDSFWCICPFFPVLHGLCCTLRHHLILSLFIYPSAPSSDVYAIIRAWLPQTFLVWLWPCRQDYAHSSEQVLSCDIWEYLYPIKAVSQILGSYLNFCTENCRNLWDG